MLPEILPEMVELIPRRGLGEPHQSLIMKDICAYLSDALEHMPCFYCTDIDNKDKLIPPDVMGASRWHATRQEDWKQVQL